ncbi:unnamed protein product [Arctia plantaginis]|uniref:Pre-rRNA-processing protein RIX1 N-terminal domain-containing protein n=1 Tax=Arctia plantaginis TaxID=874455 RepID=A0A8S1BT73_ARCPL|nr:unnamed protein product [Arctia plantaginis]
MSRILENLRNVDPNNSDAVKEIITAFFQNLPKHTEENCNVWLRVLEHVITRFPRYCAQHRSTIENHIAHFLDCANYYNVIEAAKSAHGLQQIRPSQDKTATAKNCWREQMSLLCNTAHKLIEAVFSKTVNIYKDSRNVKKLPTQLLSNTPLSTALSHVLDVKKTTPNTNSLDKDVILCNKLRNIFIFIQAMLVEVYPVAKPIQPQLILEVIVQALSVSSSANTNVTEAATVKIQAHRTLDALILCLGPNLIPFSALVFRCVMQTLRWSSDNPTEESSKVRCVAYNSLSRWLNTLHVHRVSSDDKGRSWEDEITNHIITDITPPKKTVELTMSNQYTKNLSKKARKKLANTMLQKSSLASHTPGEKNKLTVIEETNDEVANAALECLETFLTVCGIFLKQTTHKVFQERLVRECYNLDSYSKARSVRLLRALDGCRKNTPSNVPPPTQYLLQLYSTLINSQCDEVKKFSSQAILEIRLHLHCSPPSLNFAIEAPVDENKTKDKRKRISERNRAALESLLGKERMPPANDEVITIADEPSTKRSRLESEVVLDNISVSSESAKSIEISDDDADNDVVREVELESQELQDKTEEDSNKQDTLTILEVHDDAQASNTIIDIDEPGASTSLSPQQELSQCEITPETNIYEAKTQIPLNISADTIEGNKSPISMEVVYDTNAEKNVKVLEKMDDENLPSTNDTDDVQITCGQCVKSSQELEKDQDPEKHKEVENIPEVNETNEAELVLENGNGNEVIENIEVKITTKEITVDDMLADFVDEVNEETSAEATEV